MADAGSPVRTVAQGGECPRCGGSGWIIVERDGISGAERCECVVESRPKRIEQHAEIPPLYRNVSLDSFRTIGAGFMPAEEMGLRQLLLQLRNYIREYPLAEPSGLLFIGGPGTGKTHLAVAVLRALIEKCADGLFCDYQTLLDRIRSGYDAQSGSTDREAYRTALDVELLMLDDLGAHRVTDFTQDVVTGILTHRCNHRKPIIATTNYPIEQALQQQAAATPRTLGEVIGWRAVSRLHEMCRIIKMPTLTDYRMRKK